MNDLPGELNLGASQTNVWQYVSGTWNSGSTTSVVIRLVTDNGLNGSVWFDDIDFEIANIIPNSSFETAGANSADAANWIEGNSHIRSNDKVHSGGWALKSTYTGVGTDTHTAPIAVTPNTTYTLSGYIWKSTSAGAAYIDMTDIPGELTLRSTQTGVWQFVSGAWNSGTRTSVVIRLVTDSNPTAAVWFDDITFTAGTSGAVIAAGAGDIACDPVANPSSLCHHMQTSDLLLQINPDVVLTFGDNQYENGQYNNFLNYYDPSWGRVKAKTRPSAGNHEYNNTPPTATGYYDYFNGIGNANGPAGDRTKGYYSFDQGAWHFIALNSNCTVIGCGTTSAQYAWLQNDLAAHPSRCTLAYWHHPVFTIGDHQPDEMGMRSLLQLLYDNNADLVLNGHDHNYQRWAPQKPDGTLDTARGIREIIVGTGGRDHAGFSRSSPNVESSNSNTFGVLKLTLRPDSYDWQFIPEAGQTFTDSGSTACH